MVGSARKFLGQQVLQSCQGYETKRQTTGVTQLCYQGSAQTPLGHTYEKRLCYMSSNHLLDLPLGPGPMAPWPAQPAPTACPSKSCFLYCETMDANVLSSCADACLATCPLLVVAVTRTCRSESNFARGVDEVGLLTPQRLESRPVCLTTLEPSCKVCRRSACRPLCKLPTSAVTKAVDLRFSR